MLRLSLATALAALLIACSADQPASDVEVTPSQGESAPGSTAVVPSSAVAPTAESSSGGRQHVSGLYGPGLRLGLRELDRWIEAIENGTVDELASSLELSALPCGSDVALDRPRCGSDQVPGDEQVVFPSPTCEPWFQTSRSDAQALLDQLHGVQLRIVTIYRASIGDTAVAAAVAGVTRADPRARTFYIAEDGRLLGLGLGCARIGSQLADLLPSRADFLLTPLFPLPVEPGTVPPTIRQIVANSGELQRHAYWLNIAAGHDPCADSTQPVCIADLDVASSIEGVRQLCWREWPSEFRDRIAGVTERYTAYLALAEATCLTVEDGFRTLGPVTDQNIAEWQVIAARARDLATLAFEEGQRLQARLDAVE